MSHTTARRRVVRVTVDGPGSSSATRQDTLATEEPLQILVDRVPYATTMRTPGHDLELALGFLLSEGVITGPDDVAGAAHCSSSSPPDVSPGEGARPTYNTVTVDLRAHVPKPEASAHRHVTSACGVCGTETVEAVRTRSTQDLRLDRVSVPATVIVGMPDAMRTAQRVFDRTGGLHAAALFDATGTLLVVREDVGRHNAVDKVVGWAFTNGRLPLRAHLIQVSGRASFELVQKAWLAGCPVLSAVSAPSSLAADLAEEAGMTLIGFSRGDRFTIYTGSERIPG